MNIKLHLDNSEETLIASFYDMTSNPFSLNDVVNLNIEEIYPKELEKYNYSDKMKSDVIERNETLHTLLHTKSVKLTKEGKYVTTNVIGETKLNIEYHCEIVE